MRLLPLQGSRADARDHHVLRLSLLALLCATGIAHGDTITYTYAGETAGDADGHDAWFTDADDATTAELDTPNVTTELTTAQYTASSISDDSRVSCTDPGAGDEVFFKCFMEIAEGASTITQINFTFEGQSAIASDYQIYARNMTTGIWDAVGTVQAGGAGTDVSFSRSITSGIANYVSGGLLRWGVYQVVSTEALLVDFVKVDIVRNPMDITDVDVTQFTSDMGLRSGESPMVLLTITTTGTLTPYTLDSLTITSSVATNDQDLQASGVRVFYKTTDSLDLATDTPVTGGTATMAAGDTATFSISGVTLSMGTNYVWVTYTPVTGTASYGRNLNCYLAGGAADITFGATDDNTFSSPTFGSSTAYRALKIWANDFEYAPAMTYVEYAVTTTDFEWGLPGGNGPASDQGAEGPGRMWGTGLSANYDDTGANQGIESGTIDLSGYVSATLTFYHWRDVEANYDGGIIEVYNGSAWAQVNTASSNPSPYYDATMNAANTLGAVPGYCIDNLAWQQVTATIPPAYLVSGFKFRYHFGSDTTSIAAPGWYIDTVVLSGSPQVPRSLGSVAGTQASTEPAARGSANNAVVRVQFNVTGNTGTLTLNSITIGNTGTETDANVSPVKVWFTTSSTFSATEQLGANGTFSAGSVTITPLSGKQLPDGSSYLWISLDVGGAATLGNTADARVTALAASAAGGATDPQPTIDAALPLDPAGSRQVSLPLKSWNGGGWSLRLVDATDPSAAGSTVRLRLTTATSPTAATIWNGALGSTANDKVKSVRIFRNKAGTWTELPRDLFVFGSKKVYLDFQLPGDHVAGDLYYLGTGGTMSSSPLTYESLTDTFADNFEGGLTGWALTQPAGCSFAANGTGTPIPQGVNAMEAIDASASSYGTASKPATTASRQIMRFWMRSSGNEFVVAAMSGANFVWALGYLDGRFQTIRKKGGTPVIEPIEPSLNWVANEWYECKIDIDDTADLFDIYVNGEAYSPDNVSANAGTPDTMYVRTIFASGGEPAQITAYVDDIRWSTYNAAATHTLGTLTAGDGLWGNALNWAPIGVPTTANDVIISGASFLFQPTFAGGVPTHSVTVATGNTLTVASSTLSLEGYLDVSGTFTHTGGEVRFASIADASISALSGALTFFNLTIDSGAFSVSAGSTALTATGTLNLASGTLNLGTGSHTLQGDLARTTGTIATSLHTIQATGSANQAWSLVALTLNNLTVNKPAGTVTLTGNLTISNSLTLGGTNSGVLDLGAGTHSIGTGSFAVNGGRLDVGTSRVTTQSQLVVGASGTVRMDGGGTLELPAVGASVSGAFRAAVTASGRPTVTRIPAGSRYAFVFQDNSTVDLYGLNFDFANASGLQILDIDGSGVSRVDDVSFTNGDTAAGSCYLNLSALNSGVYTFRLNSFDSLCPITVRLRSGNPDGTPNPLAPASTAQIRMENSAGPRGDNDATTGGGVAESFDGDPDADIHITWVYFKRWLGSVNSVWSVAANWEGGTAPDPNANGGAGEDVLITAGGNPVVLDQDWTVRSLTIATGASLSLSTFTLTITGDTFQAFGGTFDPASGTVALSGTVTQTINIGTNPLWNLIIYKPSGTANLATNLKIRNALRIIDGTFDLKGYALTVGADGGTGLVYVNDERASGDTTTAVISEVGAPNAAMPPPAGTAANEKDSDGSIIGGTTSSMTVLSDLRVRGDGTDRGLVSLSGSTVWTQSGSVNPAGSVNVAGRVYLAGSARMVMGDGSGTDILAIPSGGVFEMNGGTRLEMRTTGTAAQASIAGSFITTMSGSTRPTVTSANGTNGFLFAASGSVDVGGMHFSRADDNGFDITSAATLSNLNLINFTNGSPNAGARHMRLVRSANGSFQAEGCTFDNSTSPPFCATLDDGAFSFTLFMSNATGAGVALNDSNIGSREEQLSSSDITWVDRKTWVGGWRFRRPITVANSAGTTLPAGAPVELTFSHSALTGAGESMANGNDIRVVYDNGTIRRELDRVLFRKDNNTGWGTALCTIVFPTVNSIPAAGNDPNYFVYYGNLSAGAPPASAANAGVIFLDGIESGDLTTGGWTLSQDASGWDLALAPVGVQTTPVLSGTNAMGSKRGTGTVRLYNRFKTESFSAAGFSNVFVYYARTTLDQSGPDQVGYESAYSIDGAAFVNWESVASAGTTAWTTPAGFSMPSTAVAFRLVSLFGGSATVGNYSVFDNVRVYANHNGTLPGISAPGFDGAAPQTITSQWADPFNWSPPGPPGANSAVVIDEAALDYQYAPIQNTGSSQTILSLTIGDVASGGLTLTNPLVVTRNVSVDTNGAQTAIALNSGLTVGGDWIHSEGTLSGASSTSFNRGSSLDQRIRGTSASLTFPGDVALTNSGVRLLVDIATVTINGTTTVGATDEIEVESARSLSCVGNVTVSGTLDIEAGGTLTLGNGTTVTVSGTFEAVGTGTASSQLAKVTSSDTNKANDGYAFEVTGTTRARYYSFEYMGANGVRISGPVDATDNLADGFFDNLVDNGTLLSFVNYGGGSLSIPRVSFKDSAPSAAGTWGTTKYNVRAGTAGAVVDFTFTGPSGPALGEDKDQDNAVPQRRAIWPGVTTPVLLSAVADDNSGGGAGIQAGDRVILTFDSSTNAYVVDSANINTVLDLPGADSWGTIASAVWSGGTPNTVLTVTLGSGSTGLAVGDSIAIGAATIRDPSETNNATGSPPNITGTFGANTPNLISAVAVFTDQAPAGVDAADAGPQSAEKVNLTFDDLTNKAAIGTVDDVLRLDGASRTWGTGATATWMLSDFVTPAGGSPSRWLQVSVGTGASVDIGSNIAIVGGTIKDDTGVNDATGSPPTISGTFGPVAILTAVAQNTGAGGGFNNGDSIKIDFDFATNGYAVTQGNIATVMPLTAGSWGTTSTITTVWSNGNRTLTVTFTAIGDAAITPATTQIASFGANTVEDPSSTWAPLSTPRTITGDFGALPAPVILSVVAEDTSGGGAGVQSGDRLIFNFDINTNQPSITPASLPADLTLTGGSAWGTITSVTWTNAKTLIVVFAGSGTIITTGTTQVVSDANSKIKASGAAGGDPASTGWPKTVSGDVMTVGTTFTGTIYSDEGSTIIATGGTIAISINGGAAVTGSYTGGVGTYSLLVNPAPAAGGLVLVYLNNGGGARGAMVTSTTGADIAGLNIYQSWVRVLDTNGNPGGVTNANLDTAHDGVADVPYADGGGGTLTLPSGFHLRLETDYDPNGNVVVDGGNLKRTAGELKVDAGDVIDVDGSVTLTGGTTNMGGGALQVEGTWDDSAASGGFVPTGGSVTFNGTSGGPFGVLQRTSGTRNQFWDLVVNGAAGIVYELRENGTTVTYPSGLGNGFVVAGDLTVSGGTLDLEDNDSAGDNPYVQVANSVFVANTASATIDGTGNTSTFRVGGDWTIDGSYAAGSVEVGLRGGGTVNVSSTSGTNTFASLNVGIDSTNPTVVLVNNTTVNQNSTSLVSNGTLSVNGMVLTLSGTSYTILSGGTLQLDTSSTVRLASGATLTVNSGGFLTTSLTGASSRAKIESVAGYIGLTLNGTMNTNYLWIDDLNATGVAVGASATLIGWRGIRFSGGENPAGADNSRYINLTAATGSTTLPAFIEECWFEAGPDNNVLGDLAGATHPNVTFSNWAGALGGEAFEKDDQLDLVDWGSGGNVVLNPGGGQATYATLVDAILAANANGPSVDTIEVRDNAIREEVLNIPALGANAKNIILDGAILRVPNGATSPAIIGSGDNATGEVLKNLVLLRTTGGIQPILRNAGRVFHCSIVGDRADGVLVDVTGGNSCTMQSCVVGAPAGAGGWGAGAWSPVTNAGTFSATYTDFDVTAAQLAAAPYAGTQNFRLDPLFQAYDPASGMYDLHLRPTSPCVDYAPAPPVAVDTDFDRGQDFENPGTNPRRPIDARPNSGEGGPYPTWDDDFGLYDVGADEQATFVIGTGSKAQGTPLWVNRAGTGVVADPDSFSIPITSFTFSPAVMYVGENNDVTLNPSRDVRLVAYAMNDADSDGDLDLIDSLDLTGSGIQKVYSITAIGAGTQDNLYLVVDTTDAGTEADAILAVSYTPSAAPNELAVRGDWGTNPRSPAGTGTISRIVLGQADALLYFARGNGRIYRHRQTDGTPDGGVADPGDKWVDANGQLDVVAEGYDGKFDAEGSLFAGKFNNSLYAPTNQHASEIVRIQMTNGAVASAKSCGAGDRNHFGFNVISQSVLVTEADQFVWRIHEDTLDFDGDALGWTYQSAGMGAGVRTTTRAQMFRTVDANVRVGAGSTMFKFRRETGALTLDSDAAGDDWGPGRTFRGDITTPPVLLGGTGKDYTGAADGRRCGKVVFGTDQGYCYIASYIRATLASDAEDNGETQLASTFAPYVLNIADGRPYPGFPYRIPGAKIVSLALVTSSTVGRQVIVFITDNGWAYGFIEPY